MHLSLGVVAAGAALIVGLGACGGSSTPSASTSTSQAPTPTQSTAATPTTATPTTVGLGSSTTAAVPSTPAPPSTTPKEPTLNSLVLNAAQVSLLGTTLVSEQLAPDGTSLGVATLDICATAFPSEKLRAGRLQVSYLNGNGEFSAGNEVVRYSPGGAAEAYQQLRAGVAAPCTPASGLSQLQAAPADPRLGAQQVIFTALMSASGGVPVSTAAVYQFDGNLLSAIYTYRATKALALQAAEAIATGADTKLKASGGNATGPTPVGGQAGSQGQTVMRLSSVPNSLRT